MFTKKKFSLCIILAVILLFLLYIFWSFKSRESKDFELPHTVVQNPETQSPEPETQNLEPETHDPKPETQNSEIPEKFTRNVPFTSQAPFAIWDQIHEEACEEASLVILKYYLDGKTLDKNTAEKEIQNLVKFQIDKYGDYKDTTARETVKLAEDYYGLKNLNVATDFDIQDLKRFIYENGPVIVPAAGRELGNPNFTPPGPLYHNLVLIGFDEKGFITNDPGTRKGAGYYYDEEILYGAIHDFPGDKNKITQGAKAAIVIENP